MTSGNTRVDSGFPGSASSFGLGAKLTVVGLAMYLVSWFLPVFRGEGWLGTTEALVAMLPDSKSPNLNLPEGPDWLPGWQATRIAWWFLTSDDVKADDIWRARVLGSTLATNVLMLIGMLTTSTRKPSALAGSALLACTALNTSWLYLLEGKDRPTYLLGYYCWMASFAVTGIGLMIPRRSAA